MVMCVFVDFIASIFTLKQTTTAAKAKKERREEIRND